MQTPTRVLHLGPGRSGEALRTFRNKLMKRGGKPEQITHIVMDMLHCFKRGARENFPWVQVAMIVTM